MYVSDSIPPLTEPVNGSIVSPEMLTPLFAFVPGARIRMAWTLVPCLHEVTIFKLDVGLIPELTDLESPVLSVEGFDVP